MSELEQIVAIKSGATIQPDITTATMVLIPVLPVSKQVMRLRSGRNTKTASHHLPAARLEEAIGLANAIALDIRNAQVITVNSPRPASLFGEGKIQELLVLVEDLEIELIVVDHALSPVQQRNLEKAWKVKVVDRTGLILEIFGERARTKEGRLQVELAHLEYQKSRLVRSWTHLERQRGGFGFLGGPGETQIEADRRLIRGRIENITREIDKIKRTRQLHRKARKAVPYPIVALVGYTNAGKSTLFNRLTGASVMEADMLFATLDPTMRELKLPGFGRVILSDTVGFISDLPTTLVAAFRATLEEVLEADLLLHVRDISHPDTEAQKSDVLEVLNELGIDPSASDQRIVEVWNKIDRLAQGVATVRANEAALHPQTTVAVSAIIGAGLDTLAATIEDRLTENYVEMKLRVAPEDGAFLHWVLEHAQVLNRQCDENTGFSDLVLRMPRRAMGKLDRTLADIRSEKLS